MKRKLVFSLLVAVILFGFSASVKSEGFYEQKQEDFTSSSSSDMTLRAGREEPTEPGDPSPVGDGLWVLIGAITIYGISCYRNLKQAEKSQ